MKPALDGRRARTDEALMLRAQADDPEAFAELYGRHVDYALGVARAICRDRGRAEDAVQDGFFSIWRSRADYRPQAGSFQAWSMEIIRHRAIDSLRVVGTRPPLQTADPVGESEEIDPSASPLGAAIAQGERARMFTILRRLPEIQAEVIVLSFYGEYSHSEIATRLGLPPGTVKGRMRSGLTKLRHEWVSEEAGDAAMIRRPLAQRIRSINIIPSKEIHGPRSKA